MSTSTPRFEAGTFAPDPQRASLARMVLAQGKIESLLFLRHGEQQLLNMVIPIAILVGLSQVNFFGHDDPLALAVPLTFAIAAFSSGFTSQAIAVAFDRRYGALKRIGASGVPAWTIIAGKICALIVITLLQVLVIGGTALLLGWHPTAIGVLYASVALIVGLIVSTSMGLLLGGTLPSEAVLALANLIWFVLGGAAGLAVLHPAEFHPIQLVPSAALAVGLDHAFEGIFPALQLGILAVWGVAGLWAAVRWFKFHD